MSHKKEMNHVVYSGWMIKSPPEKKLTGPWKIFRALSGDVTNISKWKKRYFVLSKPAQSLPGTYHLNYYSDENLKRVRGTIDLEQCAEIIESLDSDQFQYLLAIKTTFKGKDRTYFLATETEEQMSTWVRNLCSVCGMKPDESAEPESPQPPIREVLPSRPAQTLQPQSSSTLPASAVGIMTKPPNNVNLTVTVGTRSSPSSRSRDAPERKQKPVESMPDRDSEYIPLETCSSGQSIRRTNRQVSVDSVPDEPAPPPPIIPAKGSGDFDNEVFHPNQTYDFPPSSDPLDVYDVPPSSVHEDDVYKVPPVRPPVPDPQEMYDIPPLTKNSPSTPRSSSSDSQKADSAYSSQGLMYDTPPIRPDGLNLDEIYDIPPSHSNNISMDDVPPSRPPKPGHLQTSQEAYMNVPTNSRAYSDQAKHVDINSVVSPATAGMAKIDLNEMYDFPRSRSDNQGNYNNLSNLDTSDKLLTQTPPPPSMCAPREHRYINAKEGVVTEPDVYLQMDSTLGVVDPVPQPRESSSTDNDVEYTDMTGHSSFDDSFEGRQQIYDHPPPSRPTVPPPRPLRPASNTEKHDTYSISSSARTRSFKKRGSSPLAQIKSTPIKQESGLAKTSVPLPQRVDKHPDFSTSDEDDEEMGSADVWGTTPPAPGNKDTELKYVDLDHDDTADSEPMRSPHGAPGGLTPTEYHEIDFVRTDALRNVKETVSEERYKEKNNT